MFAGMTAWFGKPTVGVAALAQIGWSYKVSEEEMMRTTSTKRPECHCKAPPIDRHPLRSDPAEERKAGCAISGGAS